MKPALLFTVLALTLSLPWILLRDAAAQQSEPDEGTLATVALRLAPDAKIESVALAHSASVRHRVGSLERWWLLEFPSPTKAADAMAALATDERVEDAQLQKRGRFEFRVNDPLFPSQWHLKKSGGASLDINAEGAWNAGFNGSGITIMICDDSLEHTHPDIAPNYSALHSYDYNSNDANPAPDSAQESHGTATAGLAAARGDNGLGVAGVAHQATLAAIRMDAAFSDAGIASALSHSQSAIDIYSNSWGPMPWQAMGPLTRQAIMDGVNNGRGGKGCIYVWASGNGRPWGDNSNNDPFQNMPETISVSSIAIDGVVADHSERGASILVAAPAGVSSGGQQAGGNIVTTDRTGADGYGGLADADYTNTFGGTSASCPIVAGTCALMLHANPNLTWRDVQHILVETANSTNGISNTGWTTNGAGRRIHDTLGFGCVDAGAAAALAQTWAGVAARVTEITPPDNAGVPIPDANPAGVTRTIHVPNNVTIEHVVIELACTHPFWDDLRVTLTSPSGTVSVLADAPMFPSPFGPTSWEFMTTRCWGETAGGTWTLNVVDVHPQMTGSLTSWRLKVHGTGGGTVPPPPPPAPTLDVSATSLNLIAPDAATPSNPKTYTVTGANLTGDVSVTASATFEVAEAASGPWLSSVVLAPVAGSVSATVFVRFDPAGGGATSGTVTHTSPGAPTRTVSLNGLLPTGGNPSQGSKSGGGGGGGCSLHAGTAAPVAGMLALVLWRTRRRRSAGV